MRKVRLLVSLLLVALVAVQAQPKPLTARAARELLSSNKDAVLLDVRTRSEFVEARIAGSVLLPYDAIDAGTASRIIGAKDRPVIVYCRSGRRSSIAVSTLASLGYTNVYDLGGIGNWPYGTVSGEP